MLLAEEFHDIAPPVDYSLIPTWLVFLASFLVLSLVGALVWWFIARRRKRAVPPELPRERALAALTAAADEIHTTNPHQFSIRVSDILRHYVTDQYGLPLTRQTSVEFLERVNRADHFSEAEKQLLADFLNRCDLIKFARYDATPSDSQLLLEEATRFVEGGSLAHALT